MEETQGSEDEENEMALLTLNLLVWQRRNGDKAIFLLQLLVQPVEVFVPPGDLDVVKLVAKLCVLYDI